MKDHRWKGNRRILWNVLCHPEKGKPDERMEQLEQKSYRFCYLALYYSILTFPVLGNLFVCLIGAEDRYRMAMTGVYLLVILIENGRFLYRCYHGIQENSDGVRGMFTFWMNGLLSGFLWVLIAITFRGFGGWLNRIICWFGIIFYFLLCHLAYYRYALFAEVDGEEVPVKKLQRTKVLFIVLSVIYFAGIIACDTVALWYRAQFPYAPASVKLPKEEQEYLLELQEGIDRYHSLSYVKYECSYETDVEDAEDIYSNSMIGHSYFWVSPDRLYTQILNTSDGTVCREFYREGMEGWYARYEGRWIPEQAFWEEIGENSGVKPELRQVQPYTGIMEIDPKTVASVTKEKIPEGEDLAGETMYTVTYRESEKNIRERSNFPDNQISESIIEHYVLNVFGTLIQYELEENGRMKDSSKTYQERECITVQSADEKEVCQELETLLE